jgi:hypothetical protein
MDDGVLEPIRWVDTDLDECYVLSMYVSKEAMTKPNGEVMSYEICLHMCCTVD